MSYLEILLYVIGIILFWFVFTRKEKRKIGVYIFFSFSFILLLIQIIFQGAKWQLYPLYIGVLILLGLGVLNILRDIKFKGIVRNTMIITMILLFFISVSSNLVFPVYQLPTPTGDYLIGTESFIIENENRQELYNENGGNRKFKVQVWYPAETIDGYDQVPWLEDGLPVARALSIDTGLPPFVLDHTVRIMSNSYFEAPISEDLEKYPVVIISHGWRGFKNLHTDFAEELASQGYIVYGIDHTYGSVATVLGEQEIAYLNLDALPSRGTTDDFLVYANILVNTYASDITATLDYLEEINMDGHPSRFNDKLDMENIGLLGHSTGGGADVAVAIKDVRVDVLIGLDAWVEPISEEELNKGLSIPSLFLRSGAWETGYNNLYLYDLIGNSEYPSILYQIDGTTHYDFSMVYMYSPLTKYIGFTGEVDGLYLNRMLNSLIVTFFDQTLKQDTSSEINPSNWPEINVILNDD